MEVENPPIIFVMGPTAAGKTKLALELATQASSFEIVSVDSAMVYRGMDIGTGKPPPSILKQIHHHLIDICEPENTYSVAQFRENALKAIETIFAKGKTPLLVGGTMLYFRALQFGLAPLPSADSHARSRLAQESTAHGPQSMHARLKLIDPKAAARIHPNDPQRLLRALEVYELTGISLSDHFLQENPYSFPYEVITIAIAPRERQILHHRIETRFNEMLAAGFVEEVRKLYERGTLDDTKPSMRAVGYRQIWQHLEGTYDSQTMRDRAIIATRQLAKRQLTWLRGWQNISWFDSDDPNLLQKIGQFLNNRGLTLQI